MANKIIVLDLDNTLCRTNEVYFDIADKLIDFLAMFNEKGIDLHEMFRVKNKEAIETGNTNVNGFADLFVDLYRLCCENPQQMIIDVIRQGADKVYSSTPESMPYLYELLAWLRENAFKIIVYTQGNYNLQRERLYQIGIAGSIDGFVVVEKKSTATLDYLLQEYNVNPKQTWIIGDDPHKEIIPGTNLHMRTLLLPNSNLDYADLDTVHNYIVIDNLSEVPQLIECMTDEGAEICF